MPSSRFLLPEDKQEARGFAYSNACQMLCAAQLPNRDENCSWFPFLCLIGKRFKKRKKRGSARVPCALAKRAANKKTARCVLSSGLY